MRVQTVLLLPSLLLSLSVLLVSLVCLLWLVSWSAREKSGYCHIHTHAEGGREGRSVGRRAGFPSSSKSRNSVPPTSMRVGQKREYTYRLVLTCSLLFFHTQGQDILPRSISGG